jgi:hypothetical protein
MDEIRPKFARYDRVERKSTQWNHMVDYKNGLATGRQVTADDECRDQAGYPRQRCEQPDLKDTRFQTYKENRHEECICGRLSSADSIYLHVWKPSLRIAKDLAICSVLKEVNKKRGSAHV